MSRSARNKQRRTAAAGVKRGEAAARATGSKPRGTARRTVAVIGWSAVTVLGVGVLGCVAGAATIPFLGYSPGNPFATLAIAFIAPGLLVSFGLWIAYAVISQGWVDDSGNWVDTADKRSTLFRIAASAPLLLLALGAAMFGFAPLGDFVPWINDLFEDYLGPIAIGLILLSVVIAGIAGAAVMGGRRAAIVGAVFGFGLVATVFALYTGDGPWMIIGGTALAIAMVGYYLVGAISGHLPRHFRDRFGSPSAGVLGAIVAIIGILTGQWLLSIFGAGSVAAWLGILAARRRKPASGSRNAVD